MRQLRFTTKNQVDLECIRKTYLTSNVKCTKAYIHGEAEDIAGFDCPDFIDGDMEQLELPIDKQDILMVLLNGDFKCKAEFLHRPKSTSYYLLTLKDEKSALED
jgi:hypothetical protein